MQRIGALVLAACGAHAAAPIENHVQAPCREVRYDRDLAARRLIVHGDQLIALGGDVVRSYPLGGGAMTIAVATPSVAAMRFTSTRVAGRRNVPGLLRRTVYSTVHFPFGTYSK